MIQKEVMQENLTQKDITRKGGIPETEICGAIFDLDGVLLDSMAVWNDLGVRYLQKRGIQPEAGLSQILFSMSMEQGADYLKEQYQLPDTSQEILNGIEQMIQDFYFYEVQPKEGAKELLHFLQDQNVKMNPYDSGHVQSAGACDESIAAKWSVWVSAADLYHRGSGNQQA